MGRLPLSLAVVGVDFPNKKGPTRRFEVEICQPGEPVELKQEPSNRFDEHAVAVFSCRGIQIGYLPSERAAFISLFFRRGIEVRAIFQERTSWGAAVRLAFEGEDPTLPPKRSDDSDSDWWPDEEPPD